MSKVSWSMLLGEYIADEQASYASLAQKYGISKQSVVKRAKRDNWQGIKFKIQQKVVQKLSDSATDEITAAKIRQLELARMLIDRAIEFLRNADMSKMSFRTALSYLKVGVKIEREALFTQQSLLINPSPIYSPQILQIPFDDEKHKELMQWVDQENKRCEEEVMPKIRKMVEEYEKKMPELLSHLSTE